MRLSRLAIASPAAQRLQAAAAAAGRGRAHAGAAEPKLGPNPDRSNPRRARASSATAVHAPHRGTLRARASVLLASAATAPSVRPIAGAVAGAAGFWSSASAEGFAQREGDAPTPLPPRFAWEDVDWADAAALAELCSFLSEHYVGFDVTSDFVRWVLERPGAPAVSVGVRHAQRGLVAYAAAMPTVRPARPGRPAPPRPAPPLSSRFDPMQRVLVRGEEAGAVEGTLLAVHSALRGKRLAPVLFRELRRRLVSSRGGTPPPRPAPPRPAPPRQCSSPSISSPSELPRPAPSRPATPIPPPPPPHPTLPPPNPPRPAPPSPRPAPPSSVPPRPHRPAPSHPVFLQASPRPVLIVVRRAPVASSAVAMAATAALLPGPAFSVRLLRVRGLQAASAPGAPAADDSAAWGLREMTEDDVPGAARLAARALGAVRVAPALHRPEEARHALVPRPGLLFFVSFYVYSLRGGGARVASQWHLLPGSRTPAALVAAALVLARRAGADIYEGYPLVPPGAPWRHVALLFL
eukprot:tig00020610_g11939.t1